MISLISVQVWSEISRKIYISVSVNEFQEEFICERFFSGVALENDSGNSCDKQITISWVIIHWNKMHLHIIVNSIECMLCPIFWIIHMRMSGMEMHLSWCKNKFLIWEPFFCHWCTKFLVLIKEIELKRFTIIHWNLICLWNISIVLNNCIILSDHMLFVKVSGWCVEINWRLMCMFKINSF